MNVAVCCLLFLLFALGGEWPSTWLRSHILVFLFPVYWTSKHKLSDFFFLFFIFRLRDVEECAWQIHFYFLNNKKGIGAYHNTVATSELFANFELYNEE
jgi:hypothetical protein